MAIVTHLALREAFNNSTYTVFFHLLSRFSHMAAFWIVCVCVCVSKIEEFDAQKAFENEDHLVELRVHIQVHVGLVFPIKMTTRPWSNDYFS